MTLYWISEKECIEDLRRVKIGITSRNTLKRLKELEGGNPGRLEIKIELMSNVPNVIIKVERFLHKFYKNNALGREWFLLNEDQLFESITLAQKQIKIEESIIYINKQSELW
jgi:hypothetical protein